MDRAAVIEADLPELSGAVMLEVKGHTLGRVGHSRGLAEPVIVEGPIAMTRDGIIGAVFDLVCPDARAHVIGVADQVAIRVPGVGLDEFVCVSEPVGVRVFVHADKSPPRVVAIELGDCCTRALGALGAHTPGDVSLDGAGQQGRGSVCVSDTHALSEAVVLVGMRAYIVGDRFDEAVCRRVREAKWSGRLEPVIVIERHHDLVCTLVGDTREPKRRVVPVGCCGDGVLVRAFEPRLLQDERAIAHVGVRAGLSELFHPGSRRDLDALEQACRPMVGRARDLEVARVRDEPHRGRVIVEALGRAIGVLEGRQEPVRVEHEVRDGIR